MADIQRLTDGNFESFITGSSLPVLVDFWAEWCGPCRTVAPILEELAAENAGKLVIAKVNVDDDPDTPGSYNIRGIPSLLIFVGGEMKSMKVGAHSKESLQHWIDEFI